MRHINIHEFPELDKRSGPPYFSVVKLKRFFLRLTEVKDGRLRPMEFRSSLLRMEGRHAMEIPLQISFSNMTPSDAVKARIEELAEKLNRFNDRITSCRVVVRAPNRRQKSGKLYHVGIDVTIPGHEIAINRTSPQHQAHEDVYVAIRDAFDALIRRIEDVSRQQRGDTKLHAEEPYGQIVRLFPKENYGFIEDHAVGEIYFHANSVPNDGFGKLQVGTKVHYQAAQGDKGLQATVVKPVNKPRATT